MHIYGSQKLAQPFNLMLNKTHGDTEDFVTRYVIILIQILFSTELWNMVPQYRTQNNKFPDLGRIPIPSKQRARLCSNRIHRIQITGQPISCLSRQTTYHIYQAWTSRTFQPLRIPNWYARQEMVVLLIQHHVCGWKIVPPCSTLHCSFF